MSRLITYEQSEISQETQSNPSGDCLKLVNKNGQPIKYFPPPFGLEVVLDKIEGFSMLSEEYLRRNSL